MSEFKKAMDELQKDIEYRNVTKWAFWKYCSDCHKTFGSNDIAEFLELLRHHKCEAVSEGRERKKT